MGHQISIDKQLPISFRQGIQKKYHTNLFLKNRKSSQQFHQELNSVCKRSSYLQYTWAQKLLTELKSGDPNQLYSEYQTTLKENCKREGKKEKIFCPAKIQKEFISLLGQRAKEEGGVTSEELSSTFQETKCYFMVMSWLHKMVTLSSHDQENKSSHLQEEWDLAEEEQIYELLQNMAQNAFLKSRANSSRIQEENRSNRLNQNIIRLVKAMNAKKLRFFEKEAIIAKIQEELQIDSDHLEQNVQILKKIFGEEVIYGYLRTMREVGHFKVSALWSFFGEDIAE